MRVMAAKDGVLVRRRLRIFAAAVALVLLCAVCVGGVSGADVWDGESIDIDWAGSGTQANPYLITSAAELAGLAQEVNDGETFRDTYFELTTDIDLNNRKWTPIGTVDKIAERFIIFSTKIYYDNHKPFAGTFSGNGHVITNMYLECANEATGLFGCVTGTINDLSVTNSLIDITDSPISAGLLVGYLYNGGKVINGSVADSTIQIANWWSAAGTLLDGYVAGGMVGQNEGGFISGSSTSVGNVLPNWVSFKNIDIGPIVGKGGVGATGGNEPDAPTFYIINATVGDNGTTDPPEGETMVTPGFPQVYTFLPDYGYVVDTVVVDGVVSTYDKVTNSYAFDPIQENHTIDVTFKFGPTYNITIPPNLNISSKTNYGTMDVTASELWLPENGYVSVTVDSENGFELQHETENVHLSYNLKVNGKAGIITASNPYIANFTMEEYQQAVSSKPKVTLNATVLDNPPFTGNYTDMLTFTLEYNTKNN